MKVLGIIPARYASSRFPGKPLALLGGKPVIQHVWERVSAVLDDAVVATDDNRILDAVRAFGGKAVMTSDTHRSGTDRCAEVAAASDADIIINIQGDEPFVDGSQLAALISCFDDPAAQIATLCRRFSPDADFESLFDPNVVKVVCDLRGFALYFSRSVIPYVRGAEWKEWLKTTPYFAHIGLYAYRRDVLLKLAVLAPSPLETAESLEQLRWLQNGFCIKVSESQLHGVGIDTPADLKAAEQLLQNNNE